MRGRLTLYAAGTLSIVAVTVPMVGVARIDGGGRRRGFASGIRRLERTRRTAIGFVWWPAWDGVWWAPIRMEAFVLLLRAGSIRRSCAMGIRRRVMRRMLWVGRGRTAGEVVEKLVWIEILCRGSGSRGGAGALRGRGDGSV